MANKSYYDILGIDKNATPEEIKKKYRDLAKKYHPDKHGGDKEKEERFKEIQEAYNILGDENKRAQYDSGGVKNHYGWGFAGGNPFENINFDGHFNMGMGGFNKPKIKKYKGAPLKILVDITLYESYHGGNKNISREIDVKCNKCNGTGSNTSNVTECKKCGGSGEIMEQTTHPGAFFTQFRSKSCPECKGTGKHISDPCDKCNGIGIYKDKVALDIPIFAGIDSGHQYVLHNMGNAAPFNGEQGDILILYNLLPHPIYIKEGNNLLLKKDISIADAVLGVVVVITTLEEKQLKINIPPGVSSGTSLRLKNMGLKPNKIYNYHGDLLVNVNIIIPTNLSDDELEIFNNLRKLETKTTHST